MASVKRAKYRQLRSAQQGLKFNPLWYNLCRILGFPNFMKMQKMLCNKNHVYLEYFTIAFTIYKIFLHKIVICRPVNWFFHVNTFPPFTRFGFFVPFLLFPFSPCWFILLHVLKTFWSSRVIILSLFWFSLRHIHVPTFPSFVGVWGFVLASVIKQYIYIYIDETLPNFSFL